LVPEQNLSSFIWAVADLLRGDYKRSDFGKVILPLTVLRRLDCVLEPTKAAVLAEKELREGAGSGIGLRGLLGSPGELGDYSDGYPGNSLLASETQQLL
jgi:type I restriction-modification system DNA methylase subunit